MRSRSIVIASVLLTSLAATTLRGQTGEPKSGKLKISVSPIESYTFVDGRAIGPRGQSLKLSSGTHHVTVANYGYKLFEQDVSINPGETADLKVTLTPSGGKVSGPKGRIQFELGRLSLGNAGDDAVLLNGKTPGYFVGHIDEFNNDILFKQELVVPPGTHQVTVKRLANEIWSGPVTVAANQRVIVNISNGKQRVVDWPRGAKALAGDLDRFKAGAQSATVVVAPVKGAISASPSRIDCGEQSQLNWTSAETVNADISGMSPVPTEGQRAVSPKQTTDYEFTAVGPGGNVTAKTTVEVNASVVAQVQASPAEVRYRRIGDKIIEQGNTTLSWSSSNASETSLSTIGAVDRAGSQTLTPTPSSTTEGAVDETVNYTFNAKNTCGGSETKTASVHLVGSVEPVPSVVLQSIFYPTDYPTKAYPIGGLLNSQRETLAQLAAAFLKYLEYDPQAKMLLTAHADGRGPDKYNDSLSKRRVDLVKQFLTSQGIASERIETEAVGSTQPLSKSEIETLVTQNPQPIPASRSATAATTKFAYERRVDVVLDPTKQSSMQYFPNTAADAQIIWQRPKPNLTVIKQNEPNP